MRNLQTISNLVNRAKANMFEKMMKYASELSVGTSILPSMERQSNLIWACESEYSTLSQKNTFADQLANTNDDFAAPDGYVAIGYWESGYAQ